MFTAKAQFSNHNGFYASFNKRFYHYSIFKTKMTKFFHFISPFYVIKKLRGWINPNYNVGVCVGIIPIKWGVHVTMLLTPCSAKCDRKQVALSMRSTLCIIDDHPNTKKGLIWFSGLPWTTQMVDRSTMSILKWDYHYPSLTICIPLVLERPAKNLLTDIYFAMKKGNEVWTTPGGNWGQDFGKQVPCSHHYHDNNQIDWRMSSL